MKIKKFFKYIRNPADFILRLDSYFCRHYKRKVITDKCYIKLKFYKVMGYKINLRKPVTFGEKIRWIILYDRNPQYSIMADKYLAREYIAEKLGREESEKYLVPLLGVWDEFSDIDIDRLPEQFVLKCNHDSGSFVICTDKDEFDIKAANERLTKSLKTNYYLLYREWHMKNIKPKIIAEKFLGENIADYQFFCFNGKARFALIKIKSENLKNIYSLPDWKFTNIKFNNFRTDGNFEIPAPDDLPKMIELSEILSKDMAFLRVDFYYPDKKIYLGELTITPRGGFYSTEPDMTKEWGSWITLPPAPCHSERSEES